MFKKLHRHCEKWNTGTLLPHISSHCHKLQRFFQGCHKCIICLCWPCLDQAKDVVFRFIIEYSSLRDFGPEVMGLFLDEDFWKMIFWLVLKLEISYRVIISWKYFGFFKRIFWRLYFCMVKYLSFHISSFALRYILARPQCDISLVDLLVDL